MIIPLKNIHACSFCGALYHDLSYKNPNRCPVCKHGYPEVRELEGIHY